MCLLIKILQSYNDYKNLSQIYLCYPFLPSMLFSGPNLLKNNATLDGGVGGIYKEGVQNFLSKIVVPSHLSSDIFSETNNLEKVPLHFDNSSYTF